MLGGAVILTTMAGILARSINPSRSNVPVCAVIGISNARDTTVEEPKLGMIACISLRLLPTVDGIDGR